MKTDTMKAIEMKQAPKHESGFSLIELMIAMVVTLIVTGAIYGLLAGGNSAFRREPELADRQQNTRVAMSMIESDIANAGTGLPGFVQVFANGLNGHGVNGEDALEIVVGLPQCPVTNICVRAADALPFQVLETTSALPACFGIPEPAAAVAPGAGQARLGAALYGQGAVIGPVSNDGAATTCAGANTAGTKVGVRADSGPAWWRPFQGADPTIYTTPAAPTQVVPVEVVRYVIATDPADPLNPGDPNFRHLWRSVTGGRSAAPAINYNDAPVPDPPGGTWQLVARGINDLQVQYLDGDGVLKDEPGLFTVTPPNQEWNLIVRQVNVTLSSRVAGANIAGFTGTDMSDPAQIRLGQLTGQLVPRQALINLQSSTVGAQQWK